MVRAVEGQDPDRDLGELKVLGGQLDQDLGEFALMDVGREASTKHPQSVPGRVLPFQQWR
jgi:hypothetical protein